jgi:hypothetical protein
VSHLAFADASALSVTVEDRGAFDDVDAEVLIPAHVHGTAASAASATLAFALNGTIAGVTTTFVDEGSTKFDTVFIPDAFRSGPNSLEVFVVEGAEGARRLRPIP